MTQRIKFPFLINAHEYIHGVSIRPVMWLESGHMFVLKKEGLVFVSELDIYKIIFVKGVTDDALQFACEYAKKKLNRFIDSL